MSNLNQKLASIAQAAVSANQKTRDSRSSVSKGIDVATNKSYANEDKKVAAAAIRDWQNKSWTPKIEAKLKQELKTRAPHLKPGTPKYQQTYDNLFNTNLKKLTAAKNQAYQGIGVVRKAKQNQRQLDNDYREKESIRNDTVGIQAASHAARDTVSAAAGALATGTSRALRAPLQLAADVGENDDGGIFDRGAKGLERYESKIKNIYQAYSDIQNEGSFTQKVALAGIEQVPSLAATFGVAGAAGKAALAAGASGRVAALSSYGATTAAIMPQAYLDGSDSTKQELEQATPEQLASAVRSKDIYKSFFDKNVKAGMSEDDAYAKARNQTISEIAEESGENVGLATIAISMLAPGVGSQVANRVNGGALTGWGQKVFNKLAAKADGSLAAGYGLAAANVGQIAGRNVVEEALQEGYTDRVAQQTAVDVGVKEAIDMEQFKEAVIMGGVLGGLMGGGMAIGGRGTGFQQAQDNLRASQDIYAQGAQQAAALQEQITSVSPRSPEGQQLSEKLAETKQALNDMVSDAESRGIPRSSLARRAPRIEPTNINGDFDGDVDGSTEIDEQDFENLLNPEGAAQTDAPAPAPTVEPILSEQELDAQDEQIAQLIAEQQQLDDAIEDGSSTVPLEESLANAQAWYDNQRGVGQEGLSGVVARAAASEADTISNQQGPIDTTTSINDYIARQRNEQRQLDDELEQDALQANTQRDQQEIEQRAIQRDSDRAESEALIAQRAALAQPYEGESFDTTVMGADGVPFNLANFWDSKMSPAIRAQAIAKAFGGEVDQNIAKANWSDMPEGVQKAIHQWMSAQLDSVRANNQPINTDDDIVPEAPNVAQPDAPVSVNGLTMPVRSDAPIELTEDNPIVNVPAPSAKAAIKPIKEEPSNTSSSFETKDASLDKDGNAKWFGSNDKAQAFIAKKGLADTHEVVNAGKSRFEIRPIDTATNSNTETASPTTEQSQDADNGVYKSKPAARAAMKRQGLDPKQTDIVAVDGGWSLVESNKDNRTAPKDREGLTTYLAKKLDDREVIYSQAETENAIRDEMNIEFDFNNPAAYDAMESAEAYSKFAEEVLNKRKVKLTASIPAKKTDAKITGQADWQGNVARSRQLVRQLYEAGYLSQSEMQFAFEDGIDALSNAAEAGLSRQEKSIQSTKVKSSKPITDDQFAELTTSRNTPSTPTGEETTPESTPQTEVKAEESQNDVSDTETKDRFADNKLFTSDKVAAARARLKSKMGQVNSGFDPEMAIDGMTLAGAYIESGVRKFGDYAKLMIDDFGDNIKPQLLSFWEGARNWQGLDTEGMTSVAESKREYDALNATIDKTDTEQDNDNDTRTSNQDNQSSADRGLSTANQADEAGQDAGSIQAEPTSRVDAVDGDSNRSDTIPSDEDSRSDAASQRADANDRDSRADSTQSNDGATQETDQTSRVAPSNYVIDSEQASDKLSWQKVAERNVSIIELVKTLDSENRQATTQEQALLADYAGWGASEVANGIFPNPDTGKYKSDSWQALGEQLQSLLTESEYNTARQTTQYAHYTPPVLVKGIYEALEGFGFKGGQVLEPASGVGVFNGLMPRSLADVSTYVGLELDPITGRIAQHLYPDSSMQIADYIKAKLPDNHFDVAIGNPPFAGITVNYKGTGKNTTKQKLQLHDYFFAKTLDKLKPGGVMAFVTSKGTMDKTSSKTREYLAEQADLIGAIRLPQTAFKENAGTEVVTDIIFLRKRLNNESPSDTAWTQTKSIDASGKPTAINEYFVNNPDMVLGEHAITSGRFGDTYTVLPAKGNFDTQVANAVAKLPKDIFNPKRGSQAEAVKVMGLDYDAASAANKEGGVYLKDGQLMRVIDGLGQPLTQRYGTTGKAINLTAKDKSFLTDYVGVRDALKTAQRDQLMDSESWEDSLAELNNTYDAFVKNHGTLMAHTVSERENDDGTTTVTKRFTNKQRLFLDVEGVLASALENVIDDGKGTVVKGSFFEGRSLRKPKAPTINTTQDALIYALDETGVLDIDRIAGLTNQTNEQVIEYLGEQIYNDPQSNKWDLAESYLSGNVVEKLAQAVKAAETNKSYSRNVKALSEVQPAPIAPNDISSNMGAAWIPGNVVNEFTRQVLEANITAEYSKSVGLWDVSGFSKQSDYSTADRTTVQLVESILNSRKISITRKSPDGSTYTDSVATELANEVARKIKTEFKAWLWSDETRTNELAEYYNKTYNNIVPPTFNGDHLTLAGMSNKIQLRSPQKRGIYRVIRQGDVYLNHAVGAGKTFTMIAAAMEEKRLGLINKPMFVVPNHMLDQFSQEFLMLYPAANIMVADEQNFNGNNRKQFVAQAALNTPDAIIITHSGFERIGVKPETKEKFLQDKLDSWKESLESTKEDDGDNRTSVKQMERNIESITRRLDETLDAKEKDGAVFFEELGVDKLYIDEAHEFRKLDFVTKMGAIKGIDPSGSQRSMDLDMKLQLLRGTNPTRAFVGASGTPVTNTMGELYTIQRYFQPEQLEQEGLHHFDSWANQFGEVVEGLEQNAAGNYEVIPRFAKFVNVPELMSRVRSFMDVLTSQDLGDFVTRPSVKTGGREIVAIPTPDGFKEYQASLAARIDAIRKRSGKPEKGDDIILSVIGDGRFSAIDMRFVDPTLPSDPNSKLNTVIRDMVEAYHATADNDYMTDGKVDEYSGGALMMFTDIGLGEQSAASRGFDMKEWINSELIRQGVKPEHIAFMRDNKTHAKKGKLFDDMRQGRKRIMIGGKDMETGVNAQKRLTHLFHLDAPWFPSSVEQREGRIIRQGNQNTEVVIKAYATKGSYDSTMWSMVARKARFIEQAMRGDATVRSMDDVSEASAFEQASALSSGDPRAIELAGLRQDVERLNRQLSGFQNEKFGNQAKAKQARQTLARSQRELADINSLLPSHKTIETGDIIGSVAGKAFDNRAEYGQAILAEFKKQTDKLVEGLQVLGTASGYEVTYNGVMPANGSFYADANIDIPKADDASLFDTTNTKDTRPDGLTTRIVNRVNKLAEYQGKVENIIEQAAKDAENFERRASKSFDSQTELTEKSRELKALEDELAAEAEQLKAADGNNFTDADRVPTSEQPKFSKTNPAKGQTNTTSQQVIETLQKRFGKPVVASLIKSGTLRVRSLNDFVDSDGNLIIPDDAEGFYYDGKVTLIADNLTPETVVATLLHELGGHAGLQNLLSPAAYMNLMQGFDNLVKSGNKYAVVAKERADNSTATESEARDEYLPYLISEYSQATETTGAIGVIKRFVNRVVAAVRAWVRTNTGADLKLTPNDITQLAERMVKRLSDQSASNITIAGIENMPASDMQFSQAPAPQSQVDAIRKQYENTDQWMRSPNGSDTNLTEQQWLQVRTPAFKEWFGDWEGDPDNASKVMDNNGEPLVVYHGTNTDFTEFETSKRGSVFNDLASKSSFFFSTDKDDGTYFGKKAVRKNGGELNIIPSFLNIKRLSEINDDTISEYTEEWLDELRESDYNEWDFQVSTKAYQESGDITKGLELAASDVMGDSSYDGASVEGEDATWFLAKRPNQIKSATDNTGTFDANNPDIRYSRRYSNLGQDTNPVTAKEKAIDAATQAAATTLSTKFNLSLLLRRHLATPLHVGMLNPDFKKFFENIQSRIAYENNEAGRIQEYMPEIWDTRWLAGKNKEAVEKVSRALFDGTMADKVWTDLELTNNFKLNDKQIDMYRRAREAIDQSVLHMTIDTLSALAKGTKLVNIHTINRLKLNNLTPVGHSLVLQQHMRGELRKLVQAGSLTPAAEIRMQKQLDDVFEVMEAIANKYDKLVEQGYAPLMRFGHYAVEVRDKASNDLDLFELYETKGQQRKAINELKAKYDLDKFEVGTGTLNPDAFKQFTGKGLSPETVQLFASELGLDKDGAIQAYLKVAVSDRSALKRLIHRKKVPGYSEDLPRVLSAFVMSNARYSGRSLYNSEIENSIQDIKDGNLQGEAQNVFANMENPQEEFAGVRSLLFHYYMGFSTAFMVLNFTQPFTQTIPKLTAYVGVTKAHRDMTQALGIITKYVGKATIEFAKDKVGQGSINWNGFEDSLPAWVKKEDYRRMSREGHLDPQNIWMIRGLERGKAGIVSGLWGNLSRAAGWTAEVSETINRRGTMIAAFKVASRMGDTELKAKGFNSKYDFAVSVIQQTQGVYNKGNRSGLARGTGKLGQFGPLVMVFKQFSINYVEQMMRHGRDGEAKSLAVAMTWQFMLAGMLGLPFTDDLRDIIEGLLYRIFGRATNFTTFLQDELGKDNANALMYGLLSEKTRFDMYGRSNMGNFIPGTNFARPQEGDWKEVIGASSGFFENFFTAAQHITKGQYKDAAVVAAPRYVRDAAAGVEIWNNGAYRNQKGDKVMDMDRTDAVIKGLLQFNPASNAKQGRQRSEKYHMKGMLKDKTDQFVLQLAEASYQEDDDRIDKIYDNMDKWNDRNPEHFNVDIEKIEKSVERRLDRKDFTSDDRQKLPAQLDAYFEERE